MNAETLTVRAKRRQVDERPHTAATGTPRGRGALKQTRNKAVQFCAVQALSELWPALTDFTSDGCFWGAFLGMMMIACGAGCVVGTTTCTVGSGRALAGTIQLP